MFNVILSNQINLLPILRLNLFLLNKYLECASKNIYTMAKKNYFLIMDNLMNNNYNDPNNFY